MNNIRGICYKKFTGDLSTDFEIEILDGEILTLIYYLDNRQQVRQSDIILGPSLFLDIINKTVEVLPSLIENVPPEATPGNDLLAIIKSAFEETSGANVDKLEILSELGVNVYLKPDSKEFLSYLKWLKQIALEQVKFLTKKK